MELLRLRKSIGVLRVKIASDEQKVPNHFIIVNRNLNLLFLDLHKHVCTLEGCRHLLLLPLQVLSLYHIVYYFNSWPIQCVIQQGPLFIVVVITSSSKAMRKEGKKSNGPSTSNHYSSIHIRVRWS